MAVSIYGIFAGVLSRCLQVALISALSSIVLVSAAAELHGSSDPLRMRNGKGLFDDNCAACHQKDGMGLRGAFPPLASSDFLRVRPSCAIDFVVNGHTGRVIVNGKPYDGSMPPIGTGLTDQDIADIVTYALNSWGNHGPMVSGAEVAGMRRSGGH